MVVGKYKIFLIIQDILSLSYMSHLFQQTMAIRLTIRGQGKHQKITPIRTLQNKPNHHIPLIKICLS